MINLIYPESNLVLHQSGSVKLPTSNAQQLFKRTRNRARLNQLLSWLGRRPISLKDLGAAAECNITNRHYDGIHSVAIRQIQGSEGRKADFDADFNPRHNHNANRWENVYAAWQQGTPLPPVELIQIGDIYFVRDGHHRVSVAKATGRNYLDAEVTVWQSDDCAI